MDHFCISLYPGLTACIYHWAFSWDPESEFGTDSTYSVALTCWLCFLENNFFFLVIQPRTFWLRQVLLLVAAWSYCSKFFFFFFLAMCGALPVWSDMPVLCCVSNPRHQRFSTSCHLKDHIAFMKPEWIWWSSSFPIIRCHFLTSICCLDIVRTKGNNCPASWHTSFRCPAVFVSPMWPLRIHHHHVESVLMYCK